MNKILSALLVFLLPSLTVAFAPGHSLPLTVTKGQSRRSSSVQKMTASSPVEPTQRDAKYGGNMAQYLVDLHDSQATFDFCGGMMFQLVLSEALREHLSNVAADYNDNDNKSSGGGVSVAGASTYRMHQLPGYEKSASVDNLGLFHGREIRRVPWAKGGMGFVLHLSLANSEDPEGWTQQEIVGYDGWGHDVGRDWRKGDRLEKEGFADFRKKFGPDSFSLNHRFYLHWDMLNRLWLSAEDGCEGTPANVNPIQSFSED